MASTRLGRYEIVRTLALGALTDLLLGRTRGLEGFQRHVAIKQLRPEFAIDPKCYEAFVNEARLAAVLHHHNIVQVHDIDQEGGQPYFAMEYVHGIDLRTLLTRLAKRNEQLPLQHVVAIVASAAAALHHAHEQHGPDGQPLNIVHCDVTPANILIGFDGNVKVVDFGIAKAAIMRATDPGVPKGQVPYMSPEMCAGKPVDRRSDVFSLGIVLYELSTVRRLFKGQTDFHTMSAICNAEVPRPSQYRRDIPPQLEQIMLKALARDPSRRYQSAGDMSLELDKIATSVGVGATTTALANYMRLQFGDQKEPWLQQQKEDTDDEDNEPTQVDFDGPASGLAPPPSESVQKLAIPKVIDASKGSPIAQARTFALTPSAPSLRAQLPPPRQKGPTQPPPLPPIPVTEDTDERERARTNVKRVTSEPVDAHAPTDLVETLPRLQSPPRDATAIVTPLTAYANYRVPARHASRAIWWVLAVMLIAGAAVGAFVLWPVAGVREPEVLAKEPPPEEPPPPPPPTEEEVQEQTPPEEPDARSGIQMTMRDYQEAKQQEAEQAAAREADQAALAAAAELERQAAEEKKQRAAEAKERARAEKEAEQEATEPVAKKPAPPKRTTAKAPAKRTVSKAAKTPAKKRTQTKKPKWDPDDLFLDEK